jgi:hypothetical protein
VPQPSLMNLVSEIGALWLTEEEAPFPEDPICELEEEDPFPEGPLFELEDDVDFVS